MNQATVSIGSAQVADAPPVSMTLKALSELREHVGSNNEKIQAQIRVVTGIANGLHGDGPPSQNKSEEEAPLGALGHVTFNLTEQDRLLAILSDAITRL